MSGYDVRLVAIGRVETGYPSVVETPPQAPENAAEPGRVVVFDEYREGLDGLEEYPYVWLLSWLHGQSAEEAGQLRVVPRGLTGTGQTRGVFATRAPNRPSPLGMSLVRLVRVDGNVVHFEGVDLADGTPILDIKPWVSIDVPR
jgi:tRNA-Thr(GGU) m(6)t(6)A37 methyltransferase TsaA